jgi:DNA-binding NtrC family response regulator
VRPAILAYPWPGNVRELENTIERAVVLAAGPTIGIKDLGLDRAARVASSGDSQVGIPVMPSSPALPLDGVTLPADITLEEAERRYAMTILDREGGNQSAAARALGISRNKLARLLKT